MNLHLTSHGKGRPLVFFHGWGFDSSIWAALIPYLKNEYQLFLVDLPGFGLSSMMDWSQFKKSLIAKLPNQFALVGWSMGGLFATRFAYDAPNHVSHLINVASSPYFIAELEWPGITKTVLATFHARLASSINTTLESFIHLQLGTNEFAYKARVRPSLEALTTGLSVLEQWDLRKQLAVIKHPTCFMFGRLDPIIPAKVMDVLRNQYSYFDYVLFNKAAHMPFLSHIDLFIDHLKRIII